MRNTVPTAYTAVPTGVKEHPMEILTSAFIRLSEQAPFYKKLHGQVGCSPTYCFC